MRFILISIFLLFIINSCSSNNDEKIINDRISVLSYTSDLIISSELDTKNIQIDPPQEVTYWSQSGQSPHHNLPHISINYKFKDKKKILNGVGLATNTIQPIYFEDKLCNVSSKGFLRCIDLINNKITWELDLKKNDQKKYEVILGGIAYFNNQIFLVDGYGQVKAINSIDGKIIWEKNISIPIISAPLIYRGHMYFITSNNNIYALNLNNGEVKWNFQTTFDNKKNILTATPTAVENIVIVPFSNGEIIAFIYDSGNIIWTENVSKVSSLSNFDIKDITANPVIESDKVYTISNNGKLLATNLINGSSAWSIEISGSSSPVISGLQLYVLDKDARMLCVNKNTGDIYWLAQLEKSKNNKKSGKLNNWKGPYLLNGVLYSISRHGEIVTISPITGEILSSDKISINDILINPIILSDKAFFMDESSNIFEIN